MSNPGGTFQVVIIPDNLSSAAVYPMLQDESVFLLAADFDKEGLARKTRRAFIATCAPR